MNDQARESTMQREYPLASPPFRRTQSPVLHRAQIQTGGYEDVPSVHTAPTAPLPGLYSKLR